MGCQICRQKQNAPALALPPELWAQVATHMPLKDLVRTLGTCTATFQVDHQLEQTGQTLADSLPTLRHGAL